MSNVIRLLIDPPLDGPTNMARDEALLTLVGRGEAPPTLRLYQWAPPTVSLGYFQSYAEFLAQPPAVRAMPVVRRLTGGGAIIHRDELTYSLTLPIDHPLVAGNPTRLYDVLHAAAIEALAGLGIAAGRAGCNDPPNAQRGPFLCFERRHCADVVVGPHKVLGSAQRRTATAILQHGSLQLAEIGRTNDPRLIADLRSSFTESVAGRTGLPFGLSQWTATELDCAVGFFVRYDRPEWTQSR